MIYLERQPQNHQRVFVNFFYNNTNIFLIQNLKNKSNHFLKNKAPNKKLNKFKINHRKTFKIIMLMTLHKFNIKNFCLNNYLKILKNRN